MIHRYVTLRSLSSWPKPPDEPEVQAAKRSIMAQGPVPAILARQRPEGCWESPDRFYTATYSGTVWQLVTLAELGTNGDDPRIKAACEFMLDYSQEREHGGFAVHRAVRTGGGRASEVIPCLTGNMVWSLLRLGYLDDIRLRRGIEWIAAYQRFDDGVAEAPAGEPYDRREICWGTHSCHMGAVKALKALAAVPAELRSPQAEMTIERGLEYVLAHHVHKRSHDLSRVAKPGWLKLGFPLMYQTDVLEILGILTSLGCSDERMSEALAVVAAKRDDQGRWNLEAALDRARAPVQLETKGQLSKWITLRALVMFAQYAANRTATPIKAR